MKIGFGRALLGACSGTGAFEELGMQSKWRSFWHLVLMCLLTTLIMALSSAPQLYRQIKASSIALEKECGALYWSKEGIVPELEPERSRSFLIAGPLSMTYLAAGENALPENFQIGCKNGLIWSGMQIGVWRQLPDNSFEYTSVSNDFSGAESIHLTSSEELINALRNSRKLFYPQTQEATVLTAQKIRAAGVMVIILMEIMLFLGNTIQVLMYIGMFVGVFALMNLTRERKTKIGKMFVLAVYAGFPAMLIGSMAEVVNLKFLDYNTIYVFGMTIYLMFVMNSLNRKEQDAGNRNCC